MRLALLTLVATLALATSAFAQSPVAGGYGGAGNSVAQVAPSTAPVTAQGVPSSAAQEAAPEPAEDTVAAASAPEDVVGTADSAAQQSAPQPVAQITDTSGLPFTGFDLALIALGGLALVALGLAMRRLTRLLPPTA